MSHSCTHLLKALTYFRDAEEDPLPVIAHSAASSSEPDLLAPLDSPAVTRYFTIETPRLVRLSQTAG